MPLGDIFKSRKQREREARLKRRRALRDAERAVRQIEDRIEELKKKRELLWKESRDYLKAGQKEAALRSLQTYRSNEILIAQNSKKHFICQQQLLRMENAGIDQDIAQAFGALTAVLNADPAKIEQTLTELRDSIEDYEEMEKMWDDFYREDMKGMERSGETVPDLEHLMKTLEDEVAAEIGGVGESGTSKLKEEIGKGRETLRKLLEDDK